MRITENTRKILKNFTSINNAMVVSPAVEGEQFSYLRSVAPDNAAVGIAKVPELFPFTASFVEFGKFLNCLSAFADPDVDFFEHYAIISEGRQKVRFNYSEADQVKWKTTKNALSLGDTLITFEIDRAQLKNLQRQSDELKNDIVRFYDADPTEVKSILKIESFNEAAEDTTNLFTLEVPDYNTKTSDFSFMVNRSMMKFLEGDYKVSIGSRIVSFRLMDDLLDVTYYLPYYKTIKTGNIVNPE